jgi:tetratricopeptide (TPR) repeat protein
MAVFQIERLKRLPQRSNETWQGGFIRLPGWVTDEGPKPFRAMNVMWGSLQTGKIGAGKDSCRKEAIDFAVAIDSLVNFATSPDAGYRPGKLEVNDPGLAEHLSGLLAEADIRVEHRPRLLLIERCMEEMTKFWFKDKPVPPGYLQGKGVTPQRVEAFAQAASLFFQAAPWQHLNNEDLIEIESPRPEADFRFALVLGAAREEFGLGFYRSLDHFWQGTDGEYESFLAGGVWSLTFDDIASIPLADADLWEDNGLPIAGENAYPVAMHFEESMRLRRPSASAMTFMEGLMRALAATTEDEMDAGRWTKRVATFDGPADYVLSLPLLLKPPAHQEMYEHGLGDRRAMESFHAQVDRFLADKDFDNIDDLNKAIEKEFMGKKLDPAKYKPRTPLEEAQDLCFQAFDSVGRRRIALARKAIQVCPDCADAYVILAETAATPEKAGECYSAGVEAGKRALGEKCFEENEGHFWGVTKTRPFMRALQGLAVVQIELGQIDQSIDSFQELLRLNPGDNQGVRYQILPLLLIRGRPEQAESLMAAFGEDAMATWQYCRALLTFLKGGDTPESRRQLKKAIAANPHVVKFLLGQAELEPEPDSYALGSNEEAIICASACSGAWQAVPGAVDWLKTQAAKPARPRKKPDRPKSK